MKWPSHIQIRAVIASFSLQLLCAFSLRAAPNDHLSDEDPPEQIQISQADIFINLKNIEERVDAIESASQASEGLILQDYKWDAGKGDKGYFVNKNGEQDENSILLDHRADQLDELRRFQKNMDRMAPHISVASQSRFDALKKRIEKKIEEANQLRGLAEELNKDPQLNSFTQQMRKEEQSGVESLKRAITLFKENWPLTHSSASLLRTAEGLVGSIDLSKSHLETRNLKESVDEMKKILSKAEKSPSWVSHNDKTMFEKFSKLAKALIEDWEKVEREQEKFLKGERKESFLSVSELPNGLNLPSTIPFTLENPSQTNYTSEESKQIKQQIERIRNGITTHLEQSTETIGPNLEIAYRSTLEELNKAEARLNQENLRRSNSAPFVSRFFNPFTGLNNFGGLIPNSRPFNNSDSTNSGGQPSSTPPSNPVPEKQDPTTNSLPSDSPSAQKPTEDHIVASTNNSRSLASSTGGPNGTFGGDTVPGSNTVGNTPSNTGLPNKVPSQVRDRISNLQPSGSHQTESSTDQTSSGTGKTGKRARDRSVDIDQGDSIGTNTSLKNTRARDNIYDQNGNGFTNGLAFEQARNTGTNATNLFSPFNNGLSPKELANLKELSSSTLKSSLSNLSNPNGESKNSVSDPQTDNDNSAKEVKNVDPSLDKSGFSIRKNKNKRGETANTAPTRSYGRKEGFSDDGLSYSFITNNAVSSSPIPYPETAEKTKTNYVMNPNGTFSKAQSRSGVTDTGAYKTSQSFDNTGDKENKTYQVISNDIQEGMKSLSENNSELDLRNEDSNTWLASLGLPTAADSLTRIWTELNPMNRPSKPSGLMRFLTPEEKPTKPVDSLNPETNKRGIASRAKMEASLQDQPTLLSRLLAWLGLSNSQDLGKTDKPQLQ